MNGAATPTHFAASLSALVVVLLTAAPSLAQQPPCQGEAYAELAQAVEELDDVDDEPELQFMNPDGTTTPPPPREPIVTRLDFAAMAIEHTCELSEGLEWALRGVSQVSPDMLMVTIMRGVTTDMGPLIAACGSATHGLIADSAALAPPEREQALVDACPALERLAPRETLVTLSYERLILAAAVFGELEMRSEPHAQELGRLVLGLGLTTYAGAEP